MAVGGVSRGIAVAAAGVVLISSLMAEGVQYPVTIRDWACHNRGRTSCMMATNGGSLFTAPCQWCQETSQCVPEYVGAITCPMGERYDEPLPPRCGDQEPVECVLSGGCRGLCLLPQQIEDPEHPGQMIDGDPDWDNARCVARSEPCRHPTTNAKVAPVSDVSAVPCARRANCFSCLHLVPKSVAAVDLDNGFRDYSALPDPDKGQAVCAWNTETNACEDRDTSVPDEDGPVTPNLVVRFAFCPKDEPYHSFPQD